MHRSWDALNPNTQTQNSDPYVLGAFFFGPKALNPKPEALAQNPATANPKPQTWNPEP